MSSFGCPTTFSGTWFEKSIHIKSHTESNDVTSWSQVFDLRTNYGGQSLTFHVCFKDEEYNVKSQTEWPPGSYCIIRYEGTECPDGKKYCNFLESLFG